MYYKVNKSYAVMVNATLKNRSLTSFQIVLCEQCCGCWLAMHSMPQVLKLRMLTRSPSVVGVLGTTYVMHVEDQRP